VIAVMASLVAALQGCVSSARNSVETVSGRDSGTVGITQVNALMDACRAAVAVQSNDLAQNIKINSPRIKAPRSQPCLALKWEEPESAGEEAEMLVTVRLMRLLNKLRSKDRISITPVDAGC
jgi:hypothetical protein